MKVELVNALAQGMAATIVAVGLALGRVPVGIGGAVMLSALGCGVHALSAARKVAS